MRNFWNFYTAGRIIFGAGVVNQLGRIIRDRCLKRALIITDRQLIQVGHLARLEESLPSVTNLEWTVFDGGEPEPTIETAWQACELAREFSPDVLVGLGGGSNLDLAKIVACIARHGGQPSDYFGFGKVPGPTIPVIAVPTTSGTGSEVSHAAVLTDNSNHLKVSTLSPHFRPSVAMVDPELTYSCPAKVTADSGMDALTHAIEAYTNIHHSLLPVDPGREVPYDGKNPLTDILAEKAVRLIGRHLVTSVIEPGNTAAREGMSLASMLAGMAFSNSGVAMVHGLEYPIGGEHFCSHGAGNALLLPYVMAYNLPARTYELGQIANWLGAPTDGLSPEQAAQVAIDQVSQLKSRTGIPMRLRDLGIPREALPRFARKSAGIERLMQLSPRLLSEEELLGILTSAY